MTTILLVDDETNILKSLKRALHSSGWEILTYSHPDQALEALSFTQVDLVISDYRMPEMTGVAFLSEFRKQHPDTVRLILSGQADIGGLLGAINSAEVFRFITKPWNDDELRITIEQALEFNRLKQENERLAETVRQQSKEIKTHLSELRRLENESPGITQVDWNDDGSITLTDEDFSEKDLE